MSESPKKESGLVRSAQILAPVVILVFVVVIFLRLDPLRSLTGNQPPVEDISVERVVLHADGITLHVLNSGPEPVTIAQVQVDEAYWAFSVAPSKKLPRLGKAEVSIPYPWVAGEQHDVRLMTSTGLTFDHTIGVAVTTPVPDGRRWLLLGLIGFVVGIVPVALGLAWLPLLRNMNKNVLHFILALTVGLLVFLLFDTLVEGIELAGSVPDILHATPLVFLVALVSYAFLTVVGRREVIRDRATPEGRLWIAYAIAIGIGLHNLGEGMSVGASVAAGEAALGGFLVIGFVLHNVTEGIGIGAPIAMDRPHPGRVAVLVVIAGGPAILGTWIGGFSYTPFLAVVFFSVGAGAILQVIVEVTRLLASSGERGTAGSHSWMNWLNLSGVVTGLLVMYATALLV